VRESQTVVSPYLLVACLFVSLVRLVLLVVQAEGVGSVLGQSGTAGREPP